MSDITKMLMPEFTIDSIQKADGTSIPGIKRMFDIALEIKDSVMQHGGPGIGKSQGVLQWNAEKVAEYNKRIEEGEQVKPWNPEVCDVRLSMKEPVDMIGVPIPVKDDKGNTSTVWATPSMWPKDDGKYIGGTIHLDEINQGQPAILNAAFQLIQDRALGEYKVPEGYIIIASGNPSAYNSTVSELSIPLSNRFSHFNIKADFDSWLNYRMNNGGNIDVMTFLKTQDEGLLFDKKLMEAKLDSDLSDAMFTDIVITPRSWEVVERVLNLPESKFSMTEKEKYCTGRLGLAITKKLFHFLADKAKYQDYNEILKQGKDFRDTDVERFYAVQMGCINAIINQADDEVCRKYILNFIKATRNLSSEALQVINATTLLRCKRVKGRLSLFNPIQDAGDLIAKAAKSLKY